MELLDAAEMAGMLGLPLNDNLKSVHAGLCLYGEEAGLNHPHRLAMFLAQASHETAGFRYDREVWGPTAAQKRYDTRTDLGNTPEVDGDGYKNRGRGPFQLTGAFNIQAFRDWCEERFENVPNFVENPDLLNTDPWEGLTAIWYWSWKKLNVPADAGDFNGVTKLINGGYNGLADRRSRYGALCLAMLGYGPKEVAEFQRSAGLSADGVIGPLTITAMHKALLQKPEVLFNEPDEDDAFDGVVMDIKPTLWSQGIAWLLKHLFPSRT